MGLGARDSLGAVLCATMHALSQAHASARVLLGPTCRLSAQLPAVAEWVAISCCVCFGDGACLLHTPPHAHAPPHSVDCVCCFAAASLLKAVQLLQCSCVTYGCSCCLLTFSRDCWLLSVTFRVCFVRVCWASPTALPLYPARLYCVSCCTLCFNAELVCLPSCTWPLNPEGLPPRFQGSCAEQQAVSSVPRMTADDSSWFPFGHL